MGLNYSDFLDSYYRAEGVDLNPPYKMFVPWILDNSVALTVITSIFIMAFIAYKKAFKPVAKSDSDLINKFFLLKKMDKI